MFQCFDDSSFPSAVGSTKYRRRPQSPQTTARIFADENGPGASLGSSSPPIVEVSTCSSLSKTRSDRQCGQGFMLGSVASRSCMSASSAVARARIERRDAAPVASIRWMVHTSRSAADASSVWDQPRSKRLCAIWTGSMFKVVPLDARSAPLSSTCGVRATAPARRVAASLPTVLRQHSLSISSSASARDRSGPGWQTGRR